MNGSTRMNRHLKKRKSPLKRILTIVFAAGLSVALVYLSLVVIFGFRNTSRTLPTHDGGKVTISYVGFFKEGYPAGGSVSTSKGLKGKVTKNKITYSDGAVYEGELDFDNEKIGETRMLGFASSFVAEPNTAPLPR